MRTACKMQSIPNYGRMIEEEMGDHCVVMFESNMNRVGITRLYTNSANSAGTMT